MTDPSGPRGPASLDDVRRRDLAALLSLLHARRRASRADLTALTGLNRSAPRTPTADLATAGLVRESAPVGRGGAGRPSIRQLAHGQRLRPGRVRRGARLGDDGRMTLVWGIAATGRIARSVGLVIAAQPRMRVGAVGSRDSRRAAALAAELDAPASYGSYEELVADPDVRAVYVATPHAQHAAVVELALAAGKAVLCEKPMTAALEETERLVALARASGGFLMEGMWMRFNPLVRRLHDLVRDGALGEPRALHAAFGFAADQDPTDRLWDPALGGGALLDLGVYTVDLARLLLGDPVQVQARGSLGATGVDAESTLLLTASGGAQAVLSQSLLTRLPGTATLLGSRGWGELSPSFHAPTRLTVQVGGEEPELHEIPDRKAGFVGELEEVERCLAEGRAESDVMPLSASIGTATVLAEARWQLGG